MGLDASSGGSLLASPGIRMANAFSILSHEQSTATIPLFSASKASPGRRTRGAKGLRTIAIRGTCLILKSGVASLNFANLAAVHLRGSSCFINSTKTLGGIWLDRSFKVNPKLWLTEASFEELACDTLDHSVISGCIQAGPLELDDYPISLLRDRQQHRL